MCIISMGGGHHVLGVVGLDCSCGFRCLPSMVLAKMYDYYGSSTQVFRVKI